MGWMGSLSLLTSSPHPGSGLGGFLSCLPASFTSSPQAGISHGRMVPCMEGCSVGSLRAGRSWGPQSRPEHSQGAGWPGLTPGVRTPPSPRGGVGCPAGQQPSRPADSCSSPPQHAIAFCLKESGSKPPMVMYPPPRGPRSPCPQPLLLVWLLADNSSASCCCPSPAPGCPPPTPILALGPPASHPPSWRKPQASPLSLHDC